MRLRHEAGDNRSSLLFGGRLVVLQGGSGMKPEITDLTPRATESIRSLQGGSGMKPEITEVAGGAEHLSWGFNEAPAGSRR